MPADAGWHPLHSIPGLNAMINSNYVRAARLRDIAREERRQCAEGAGLVLTGLTNGITLVS